MKSYKMSKGRNT